MNFSNKKNFGFIISSLVMIMHISLLNAQEITDSLKTKPRLSTFRIYPYPDAEKLDDCRFKAEWVRYETLSDDDINEDFSNINEFDWLKPIAAEKQIFLLGENHYYQVTHNLRNRILFALNTFDRFPLILLEQQYSISPYLDYYVGLHDDYEAENFYQNVMYDFVNTEEFYRLLQHIRRWNKINPDKRIHIGTHDIEHNYSATLKKIIEPYYKLLDTEFEIELKGFSFIDADKLIHMLKQKMESAKKQDLIGEFPFITPLYIETVIENLESFFYSKIHDFNYFRQKAIVRNMTDPRFHGKYFRESKVMIHGGGYHTPTHLYIPDGGNFLREGSYLSHDFQPTKGKTFSLYIQGMAYRIGSMAEVNLNSVLHQGSYYRNTINTFKKALKQNLVNPEDYYLFSFLTNHFDKFIFKLSYDHDFMPVMMKEIDWENVFQFSKGSSRFFYNQMKSKKNELDKHDALIFIPRSPITHAIKKKIEKKN